MNLLAAQAALQPRAVLVLGALRSRGATPPEPARPSHTEAQTSDGPAPMTRSCRPSWSRVSARAWASPSRSSRTRTSCWIRSMRWSWGASRMMTWPTRCATSPASPSRARPAARASTSAIRGLAAAVQHRDPEQPHRGHRRRRARAGLRHPARGRDLRRRRSQVLAGLGRSRAASAARSTCARRAPSITPASMPRCASRGTTTTCREYWGKKASAFISNTNSGGYLGLPAGGGVLRREDPQRLAELQHL